MRCDKRVRLRATTAMLLFMGGINFLNTGLAQATENSDTFFDEFDYSTGGSDPNIRWDMETSSRCMHRPYGAAFKEDHVTFIDGKATITLDNIPCDPNDYPFGGYCTGALYTKDTQGYGCYEVKFKPSNVSGVVSSFYTYAGPEYTQNGIVSNSQHNEIDIEFVGKNTSAVHFNFWTNDDDYSSNNEYVYDLGFDASKDFHSYGFKWTSSGIEWYVDGQPVYSVDNTDATATPKSTDTTQKIKMNAWPVDVNGREWAGPFAYPGAPIKVDYEWVKFTPGENCQISAPKNSSPTVTFATVSQSVGENAGNVTITAQVSAVSASDVTIPYTVSGTAKGDGVDHNLSNASITIPAGQATGIINFKLTDDELYEGSENIFVNMGVPVNAQKGTVNVHTVTINDNDGKPEVYLSPTTQTVTESTGAVNVTATLSKPAEIDIAVNIEATTDGTATGSGVDYTLSSTPIIIPAGKISSTSPVLNITNDKVTESDETITLRTKRFDFVCGYKCIQYSHQKITIKDDDASISPSVTFSLSNQDVAERIGVVNINAQLSSALKTDTRVPFSVTGTATGNGVDYSLPNGFITILAGQTAGSMSFKIINDTLSESNETIIISMGDMTGVNKGSITAQTVTIIDDDAKPLLKFSTDTQSVPEAVGKVYSTFVLSKPTGEDVVIDYEKLVYESMPVKASVTIPSGKTSATVSFDVINDKLYEVNEKFSVFSNYVKGAKFANSKPIIQSVAIIDDDPKPSISFTSKKQTVTENIGNAKINFVLSNAAGFGIVVPYTINGTATGYGTDHNLYNTGHVVIPAGDTQYTTTFNVINDSIYEGSETVVFTIGTPYLQETTPPVDISKGSISVHTVIIKDDEPIPSVKFTSTSQTVNENAGTVTIDATLSTASGLDVKIPLSVFGSATGGGIDYNMPTKIITIPAGQKTGTVNITIIDDKKYESNEILYIKMGTPTNATKGSMLHRVGIIDNDPKPTL